jgi:hypothetical protein
MHDRLTRDKTRGVRCLVVLGLLSGALVAMATVVHAQEVGYGREVRRLAARADVRAAFSAVDRWRSQVRADLIRLTEIPAPPFGEAPRALAYGQMLQAAGADTVWTDVEGNGFPRGQASRCGNAATRSLPRGLATTRGG